MKTSRCLGALGAVAIAAMLGSYVHAQQRQRGTEYQKVDHFEHPFYPNIARSARVQGGVVLNVTIDERGRVVEASALSGPRLLVRDAIENVKKWTFYESAQREEVIVFAFVLDSRACGKKNAPDKDLVELVQPNLVLLTACPPRTDV